MRELECPYCEAIFEIPLSQLVGVCPDCARKFEVDDGMKFIGDQHEPEFDVYWERNGEE